MLLGRSGGSAYDTDELVQARKISDQLAIAVTNSKLMERMENLARGSIEALAKSVFP